MPSVTPRHQVRSGHLESAPRSVPGPASPVGDPPAHDPHRPAPRNPGGGAFPGYFRHGPLAFPGERHESVTKSGAFSLRSDSDVKCVTRTGKGQLGKAEGDLLPTSAPWSTTSRTSAVPTQGDPPLHPPFPFWALADRRLFLSASGGSRGRCAGSSLARLPVPLRPSHEARHALRPAHWAHRRCRRPAAAPPRPLDVSTLSHLTLRHLTLTSLLPFEPGGLDPVAPEGPTSARCSPRRGQSRGAAGPLRRRRRRRP